jgi:hypothetical protein
MSDLMEYEFSEFLFWDITYDATGEGGFQWNMNVALAMDLVFVRIDFMTAAALLKHSTL